MTAKRAGFGRVAHGKITKAKPLPTSISSAGAYVQTVLERACRRRFFVLLAEESAVTCALVLLGGILLLVLGTDLLSSYWLLAFALAGAGMTAFQIHRRTATPYRVAQLLDRKLALKDSLSTAWFLLHRTDTSSNSAAEFEIEQASAAAKTVNPAQAFPFKGGRTWAATAALAALAFGLFAARYLVTDSLSLKRSILPLPFISAYERADIASPPNGGLPGAAALQAKAGDRSEGSQRFGAAKAADGGASGSGQGSGTASTESPPQSPRAQSASSAQTGKPGTGQAGAAPDARGSAGRGDRAGDQPGKNAEENGNSDSGQQSSSGLLDKMKDALSSLMAKMRPEANSSSSRRNQDSAANQESSTEKQDDQQARSGPNERRGPAQGQVPVKTSEQAQTSKGQGSNTSPENGSNAQSGVGRQDGSKDLKEAEQLQAIGKLAEIIGKRSASLTGDMTVESSSAKQQLKTNYSQALGKHSDLGGEINRDEIPLADQQYVRTYMELVRKQSNHAQ